MIFINLIFKYFYLHYVDILENIELTILDNLPFAHDKSSYQPDRALPHRREIVDDYLTRLFERR